MSTRVRKLGTGACFSVSARQILHFTSNVAPVDVAIRPASGTKAALTDGGGDFIWKLVWKLVARGPSGGWG